MLSPGKKWRVIISIVQVETDIVRYNRFWKENVICLLSGDVLSKTQFLYLQHMLRGGRNEETFGTH